MTGKSGRLGMKALPKWFFAAVDIVAVLNEQSDYTKNRNYWKYLKNKLKKDNPELVSAANQLKLTAPDGKKRFTVESPWLWMRKANIRQSRERSPLLAGGRSSPEQPLSSAATATNSRLCRRNSPVSK